MNKNETTEKVDYYRLDHESRITRVETTVENINDTLKRLENKIDDGFKTVSNRLWSNFYWMIGGFGSILLLIAHGFKWI